MGDHKDAVLKKPQPPPLDRTAASSSTGTPDSEQITFQHRDYHLYQEHGPPIDNLPPDSGEEDYEEDEDLLWERIRDYCRDPFAEFLGTMIMIIFGDGSVAQVTLSANPALAEGNQNKGNYQSISWRYAYFNFTM